MEAMLETVKNSPILLAVLARAGAIAATIIAALVVLRLLAVTRDRVSVALRERNRGESLEAAESVNRAETVVRVGYDVVKAVVIGFMAITVLGQLGVSVQPLVAGAGLIGAALALGSQTIVKDFVAGFFILFEHQFDIGDQVTIGTVSGVVERMTLRVTFLRDLDGTVHVVPNGAIIVVSNRTYEYSQPMASMFFSSTNDVVAVRAALLKAASATEARDPDKAVLLGEVQVQGPLSVKGVAFEMALSARTRAGEAQKVKGWLIEEAVKAVNDAKLTLSA